MNNIRLRRASNARRPSITIDANETKPIEARTPMKVLVFNGKCSEIFKSTIEECVDDCVLEFSGQPAIYVSKNGQRLTGNATNSHSQFPPSASSRAFRRRSSVAPFNLLQTVGTRSNPTNNITLSTAALTATSATRMRQQANHQQKFTLVDQIMEEMIDQESIVQDPPVTECDSVQQQQNTTEEEVQMFVLNSNSSSQTFLPNRHRLPSARAYSSFQQRQKSFRLSDLVMRGPEYYAHIFQLPRTSRYPPTRTSSRQRANTARDGQHYDNRSDELEGIKQDLFHRYLWTQNPQVSCRIRPISTYTRSTTFVL